MDEHDKLLLDAGNVMRTRVTVVGINIAIVSIRLSALRRSVAGRPISPALTRPDADVASTYRSLETGDGYARST